MPHGSAIEFAVKKDPRFLKMATDAFTHAKRIFVVGDEMHNRVKTIFSTVSNIENKMIKLNLGVDTKLFKPIPSDLRTKNIENLCKRLENMPRGKKSEQSQALKEGLFSNIQKEELQQQITSSGAIPFFTCFNGEEIITILSLSILSSKVSSSDSHASLPPGISEQSLSPQTRGSGFFPLPYASASSKNSSNPNIEPNNKTLRIIAYFLIHSFYEHFG